MNIEKDYYETLGVLPSAEIIVIKAAYRALSKRYHPDTYAGRANIAEKMADINEAYETLSNTAKKLEYDRERGSKGQSGYDFVNDDFGTHNTIDPLDEDWEVAIKYHPSLDEAAAKLTKYSKKLAYTYKAYMLNTKDFDNINEIAKAIVDEFLKLHFGNNQKIILFANDLFTDGRTDLLLELNKAIKVLGQSNADERVISKIKAENDYYSSKERFNLWLKQHDAHTSISEPDVPTLYSLWKSSPNKAKSQLEALIKKTAFDQGVWEQLT
ncbi:MAG: J domain-containing protein [Opitutaceae bacterium]